MAESQQYAENDPRHHTEQVRERLTELAEHLRVHVHQVGDPRVAALFETAAEVVGGLSRAFADFEERNIGI